jgi:hypothetical protein
LAIVAGQLLPVPQDVCLASERCIPCFNPIDGSDNGVCHYACDPGPQREPKILPGCCGADGFCVDSTLLGPADRARLAQETCGSGKVCAPKDPSTTNFACEVRGSEPAPTTQSGGAGGTTAGDAGGASQKDGGHKGGAPAAASTDSGCGCRVAERDQGAADMRWIAAAAATICVVASRRRRRVLRF